MTLIKWRTTKIPEFYFNEIESILNSNQMYVSVSDFIRKAIEEKLSRNQNKDFLIIKDLIFTESRINQIHNIICEKFRVDSKEILKENINKIIEESLDIDMISFLSKFAYNFAKYHPFEDANKRTLLVTIDSFLRLNSKKLKLEAKKNKETEEEIFFWQNSTQQKNLDEIKKFIETHLNKHISSNNIEEEINNSIEDNNLMLEKLSR